MPESASQAVWPNYASPEADVARFWRLLLRGLSLMLLTVSVGYSQNLADLPDPLVGTWSTFELSHGNTYPGVFTPFGMIGWTAQTSEGGRPYQYFNGTIQGFLATHRPSAWMADYGAFSLMPGTGKLKVEPGARLSHFKHENEVALPYRYSVFLDECHVKVEMAPASHCAAFRFTFTSTDEAYIVLDAMKGGGTVQIHPENHTITGTNASIRKNSAPGFTQYFFLVFDHAFSRSGTWEIPEERQAPASAEPVAALVSNLARRKGNHVGAYVGFAAREGEAVSVRVGVSLISVEQAERNLRTEIGDEGFDPAAARAKAVWEQQLGKLEVHGGTAAARKTFYTALYRAVQFPHLLHETDATGKMIHWSPYDGKVHEGEMFADTGFWDTFRAQFPLLTIIEPKRDAEIIRAMLHAYDEGGFIPKWPNPGESNVMIGTHGDSVVADAYLKGIRDFDATKAYAALHKDATVPGSPPFKARSGLEDYIRLGYVPSDRGVRESVSCTLEYAYDDFAVAEMARALGHESDYVTFMARSKNYRHLYDATVGFMRGRKGDGAWLEPFDPLAWGGVYTEGNAWQWLWSVQQDVPGLIELLGGRDAFIRKLDALFSATSDFSVGGYGRVIHEMTEAKMAGLGQYAHINEPVHHVIYLYCYVGQPWKTQRWVRKVEDEQYKPGPAGWLGDEDTGQMSSWYIFSSLGFYPVLPGQPIYALGSPQFDRAILHLENGRNFSVEAEKTRPDDIYVQSVTLNGAPLNRPWIYHSEIVSGGVLRFHLGPQPNMQWGTESMPKP